MARLTEKQIRAIHARKWNSPRTTEAERAAVLSRVGFAQTAQIRGVLTPLRQRKYKDLPIEVKDQLILSERDRGV